MTLVAEISSDRWQHRLPRSGIPRPSIETTLTHLRAHRPAICFVSAGAGLLALALSAPHADIAVSNWRVKSAMMDLPSTVKTSLASMTRTPATDIALTLSLLESDPHIRAERALYDAALLRPTAGVARLKALSARVTPSKASLTDLVSTGIAILDEQEAAPVVAHAFKRKDQRRYVVKSRPAAAPGYIDAVLTDAAFNVGVDLQYLRQTAARESRFNSYAAARTSSARGLFQFIDSTWLLAVRRWGPRHGLESEAARIQLDRQGRAFVADPHTRRRILALRYDPVLSSRLAAESTAYNQRVLAAAFGREPSRGELYAAHFLGTQGAVRLVSVAYRQPGYPASLLFPAAAAKNRRLFYTRNDFPRSVSELLYGFH